MSADRPQVKAHQRFVEHRDQLSELDLEQRFQYIFEKNLWSNEESRSGPGSTLDETAVLRLAIPALLREIGARSLLDIPCGDFRWLSQVDLGVSYIGADIVEALVQANRERYGATDRQFTQLDLTRDALPRADAVLCRDCLVHLSYSNVTRALRAIRASGAQWLLTTSFLHIEENRDIEDGDWRPLNFELPPFGFPPPGRILLEGCQEAGGAYNDKALCLWRTADLPT